MSSRRHCIIAGTGIAQQLGYLLQLSEPFQRDFTIAIHQFTGRERNAEPLEREIERTSLFIYHPTSGTPYRSRNAGYDGFVGCFPSGVQHITHPCPAFAPLWPCHTVDPRYREPAPVVVGDDDSTLYAYADCIVLNLRRQGKSPEEIVAEYAAMDLPEIVDIDRLFEQALEGQCRSEAETDVKVGDFIAERFREEALFLCVDRPANALLIRIADEILRQSGYPPLPRSVHTALSELLAPAIPIHPSVVRHYRLAWVAAGQRYQIDARRRLTWEEYVWQLAAADGRSLAEPVVIDRRAAVDRRIDEMLARLGDPALRAVDLSALHTEFRQAYPDRNFPLLLEKKSLDLALAANPEAHHLRPRLGQVNRLLSGTWPLLGVAYDAAAIEHDLIAEDGVEAALLALSPGERQMEHAAAAFQRYIASGKPERFPAELVDRVRRYREGERSRDSDAKAVPSAAGFPEFDFRSTPLPTILDAYLKNGCVLLRNFVKADRLHRLRDDLFEYQAALTSGPTIGDLESLGVPPFHERLFGYRQNELLQRLFGDFQFAPSPHTQARIVAVGQTPAAEGSQEPLELHLDAFFHSLAFTANIWIPLRACGIELPSLAAVCTSFADVLAFAGYGTLWDDKDDPHWNFGRFDPQMKQICNGEFSLPKLHERFPGKVWTPSYELGDALMISNWTLHFTHETPAMNGRRENLELRFSSAASLGDVLSMHGVAPAGEGGGDAA